MGVIEVFFIVVTGFVAFFLAKFIYSRGKVSDEVYNNLKSVEATLLEKVSRLENDNSILLKDNHYKDEKNLELNRISAGLEAKIPYFEETVRSLQVEKDEIKISSTSLQQTLVSLSSQVSALESSLQQKEELIKSIQIERDQAKRLNDSFQQNIIELNSRSSSLEAQNQSKEEQLKSLKENFDEVRKQSKEEFENIASKILESKSKSFSEQNEKNMEGILNPFKEKLSDFQSTVTKYREDEMKDVASLKTEIQNIYQLNKKLSMDAENLTSALKGNKKTLGNWGEMILARVLESSGLREGEEYTLQAKDMKLKNDEGGRQLPDAIVKLPDDKHVVIDSKVTLNSYDRYISSEDDVERLVFLKEFSNSIEKHIQELSGKKYDFLNKLTSPDFVLMFIPIEGAFATALQSNNRIFEYGWDNRIIIVSPTTLMVTLKTIESIWKQEKQNKNTLEIVRQAGDLYDKFHGFHEDLDALGNSINKSKENFDKSMSKLKTGKGNILGRFDRLKELGAKTTKKLSLEYEED